jgi:Mg2+-importing ATPase
MSVVLKTPAGGRRLLVKGAPEAVIKRCTRFELDGDVSPITDALIDDLRDEYQDLGGEGFRVLAVAYREVDEKPAYHEADESDLILRGYVAFLDPPKDSAAPALLALAGHGVRVKVLSGDDPLVCGKVCREVGLTTGHILLGSEIEAMQDEELSRAAAETNIFARVSPLDKQRIVRALQHAGHVVGFLGDGINDAPALHAADVGISVDTAVDVAKASADLILLEKSLLVLDDGVLEGRKVFANVLKYVRMGASSSFGNMLSVLGASLFLPFVPMAPIQILANNLLYDISQVPIPTDHVDPEEIEKPRPWHIGDVRRFILCFGPVSSIFDYATFWLMLVVFNCWEASDEHVRLFQTGWFIESLLTQTLIIHIIRTRHVPFLQSLASPPLMATSVLVMTVGLWLPFSPLAPAFRLVPPPMPYFAALTGIIAGYALLAQAVKAFLFRRGWIS